MSQSSRIEWTEATWNPTEELIEQIEGKLAQLTQLGQLFVIKWSLA